MTEELAIAVADMLRRMGDVRWRRFFSGYELLCDGTQFAAFIRGVMYFRADEELAAALAAEGAKPFTYTRKRGPITVQGYQSVPEAWLDDEDTLLEWSRKAFAAALKRDARKPKKRKKADAALPPKPMAKAGAKAKAPGKRKAPAKTAAERRAK